MKTKIEIHQFDPVIYPLKLWVINDLHSDIIRETFEEYDGNEMELDSRDNNAASTYNKVLSHKGTGLWGILIEINSDITVNQIAHEATHAARVWWNWLEEDQTGREADAYLVGWIAECIEKVKLGIE